MDEVHNLRCGQSDVERHIDRADRENPLIGNRPLRTILRKQGNAVTLPYAEFRKACANLLDALAEVVRTDRLVHSVALHLQSIGSPMSLASMFKKIDQSFE